MPGRQPPVVTFLSDFGLDGAAAICRGVILTHCPEAQIVDIAHTVAKFSVADGAFVLASALPWMPVAIHLAVVDPGVGTSRRPIAVRAVRGDLLVGPDNGLLIDAAQALGGIEAARELANRALWAPVVSHTFHARDIFAPVAGRLAAGTAVFAEVGPEVPVAELVRLRRPEATFRDGWLETEVIYVDSFGNLRLAGSGSDLAALAGPATGPTALRIELPDADARRSSAFDGTLAATFGDVPPGDVLVYLDSSGHPALGVSQGSAGVRLGVRSGMRVRLRRR